MLVYALLGLIIAVSAAQIISWFQYRKYKFPPSPPGRLPLIGHAHLMPKRFPGDKAKQWGNTLLQVP